MGRSYGQSTMPRGAFLLNPHHLLEIAQRLAQGQSPRRPRETELRRAISTVYYALFHTLAICCANMLVGSTRASRSQSAWRQAYRALKHGQAKKRCMNQAVMRQFAGSPRIWGVLLAAMQEERERADYDPLAQFFRTDALQRIFVKKMRSSSTPQHSFRKPFALDPILVGSEVPLMF